MRFGGRWANYWRRCCCCCCFLGGRERRIGRRSRGRRRDSSRGGASMSRRFCCVWGSVRGLRLPTTSHMRMGNRSACILNVSQRFDDVDQFPSLIPSLYTLSILGRIYSKTYMQDLFSHSLVIHQSSCQVRADEKEVYDNVDSPKRKQQQQQKKESRSSPFLTLVPITHLHSTIHHAPRHLARPLPLNPLPLPPTPPRPHRP